MKPYFSRLLCFTTLILVSLAACYPVEVQQPTATIPEPTQEFQLQPTDTLTPEVIDSPTPTETIALPTETSTPTKTKQPPTKTKVPPTPKPTIQPIANGQLVFVSEGKIWRYIFDTDELTKVTKKNREYWNLKLSPDGMHLAYVEDGTPYIQNLEGGRPVDLSELGQFIGWADQPGQFFSLKGEKDCYTLENLEEQTSLSFDVLRVDLDSLDSSQWVAAISPGYRVPKSITRDGGFACFIDCRCFSECPTHSLWNLTSGSLVQTSYQGNSLGEIAFSPDDQQLTFSYLQYMWVESPLVVANTNFTNARTIYFRTGTALIQPLWSPDGKWIAFSAMTPDEEGMKIVNSKAVIIRPDGSNETVVDENFAQAVVWSPDASALLINEKVDSTFRYFLYLLETGEIIPLAFLENAKYVDWGNLP